MLRSALALALLAHACTGSPSGANRPAEDITSLLTGLLPGSAFSTLGHASGGARSPRRHHAPIVQEATPPETTAVEGAKESSTAATVAEAAAAEAAEAEAAVALAEAEAEAARKTAEAKAAEAPAAPRNDFSDVLDRPTVRNSDARRKKKGKIFEVQEMAGITEPLGFWDPLGFTNGADEYKMRWYRESEVKHGRIAMLAAIGLPVAEVFHPMHEDFDLPGIFAYSAPGGAGSLSNLFTIFWPVQLAIFGAMEQITTFDKIIPPWERTFAMKSGYDIGDIGWDPLGLKPSNPRDLKIMTTKELMHGRTAMVAFVLMVLEELATRATLFTNVHMPA